MTNDENRLQVLRNKPRTPTEESEMQGLIARGVVAPGDPRDPRPDGRRDGSVSDTSRDDNPSGRREDEPVQTDFTAEQARLAELKLLPVASKDEHREIAVLEDQLRNVPPGVPIETQAELDARENRQNREAAERDEVCARIADMNDSGWHGLREVLRQHGFGSLFRPDRAGRLGTDRTGTDQADRTNQASQADRTNQNQNTTDQTNRTDRQARP